LKIKSSGAPTSLARKIAAKKEMAKARAGKNSFPPTPFLFARPSRSEAPPPCSLRAEPSKKVFFSF